MIFRKYILVFKYGCKFVGNYVLEKIAVQTESRKIYRFDCFSQTRLGFFAIIIIVQSQQHMIHEIHEKI